VRLSSPDTISGHKACRFVRLAGERSKLCSARPGYQGHHQKSPGGLSKLQGLAEMSLNVQYFNQLVNKQLIIILFPGCSIATCRFL
jgi:hypothetical protein